MKRFRGQLLLGLDVVTVVLVYIIAIIIRFDFRYKIALAHEGFVSFLPIVALVYILVFFISKTYKSVWERVSLEEGFRIVIANVVATTIITIILFFYDARPVPFSVIVIAFLLNTLLQETFRFSYRLYRYKRVRVRKNNNKDVRVLIYGAGNTGAFVANEFGSNEKSGYYVVGFIDDNPLLKNKYIAGNYVFGNSSIIKKIVDQHLVDEIIVAMPNQTQEKQHEIEKMVYPLGLPVRSLKSSRLLFNRDIKKSLKTVEITDLLQRKEIVLRDDKVRESIEGKSVLVTGAAGSIGSELVRQIVKFNPSKIVLIDLNENALYELQQEMKQKYNGELNVELHFLIASIRDRYRLDGIFKEHQFDLLFHAAAHKHVPLMEDSPKEAIKNNILGTKNLIDLAGKYEIEKLVNISTDKAVNPTNVMGATKRFNEMVLQSQDPKLRTKFMAVRFGNVLGSNGSVVPHFKKQIAAGGPVTVTHKEITRYFMTIPEAVSLVLIAETFAQGGEIFVLNMGEPVKIVDLAEQMIKLSGYTPYEDIDIEFTGLRPGEKLYEELLMAEEGLTKTENDLIYIAHPVLTPIEELEDHISNFKEMLKMNVSKAEIHKLIKDAVPTFITKEEI